MYVVDSVFIDVKSQISDEHLGEFKSDFGFEIELKGVSFDDNGTSNEFEYRTNHKLLVEFKAYLRNWLDEHNFNYNYTTLSSDILLYTPEKLFKSQIQEFENEFNVKCLNYSITCDSGQIRYQFA